MVARQDGVEDVDRGQVGELRYGDLAEFARRDPEVEGGADAYGGVGDQGEPLAGQGDGHRGLVLFGDVDDGNGDSQRPPGRVVEPVEGDRPGVVPVRIGGRTAGDEPVQLGPAGGQDLAHGRFDGRSVQTGEGLVDAAADVPGGGQAVDPFQGRVDQDVAELGVEDGQADRGLGDQPHGQGQVAFHAPQGGLVGGDAEGVEAPLAVLQPHVAEFRRPGAAVLVPHGERPAHGPPPAITFSKRERTTPRCSSSTRSSAAYRPSASSAV